MPQVPYQPIENVGPSGQETPSIADRVPEAAFGTNVAQAVEGLGKTIEQSSGQIFQEAYPPSEPEERSRCAGCRIPTS